MLDYCAHISASLAGLILFTLGVLGLSGMPFAVSPAVTVLLQPLGWESFYDTAYYIAFVLLGFWLVLCVYVRIAGLLALALVFFKIMVVY
ncbi:hypothetical protein [Yoonia sp.]|uniref:hypothetical protein n=1 Tax=Yoonia sp. TaxID=2212373 RepID=UPI003A4DDB38